MWATIRKMQQGVQLQIHTCVTNSVVRWWESQFVNVQAKKTQLLRDHKAALQHALDTALSPAVVLSDYILFVNQVHASRLNVPDVV